MLKISIIENPHRRRLVVEGKLIEPWATNFAAAYEKARADLRGRELTVDLTSITAISPEGESILLQLMTAKVKLHCGVFMKEVIKQLARKRDRD
jgi:hypothetical protein